MRGGRAVQTMTHFSTRDAARILHASEPRVRTWARMGGIVPEASGRLEFTFQELLILRTIRGLVDAGIPARRVRRIWTSLQKQLSEDLPLTSIRILADGKRAIAWDGKAPWQPDSGQFVLDFEAGELAEAAEAAGIAEAAEGAAIAAPALELVPRSPVPIAFDSKRSDAGRVDSGGEDAERTGEQWFRLGSELEGSSPLEARQAYLRAVEVDPTCADAHLNLGRLDHRAGALAAAEARYRKAIECAPDDALAHFNLAVLLEDRRCPNAAIEAYEQAIDRDPALADAHYNLGLLLDAQGRRADALRHLMTAKHLYSL